MLFSEYFDLGAIEEPEWFDPYLSLDTKLFVDPFLIYDNEQGIFVGSHDEIIGFFNLAFELIAQSGGDENSTYWRKAARLLNFPEVEELCLGYTNVGTRGAGSGRDVARSISRGMWRAIEQGIKGMRHFEEVQIFEEGIGPDRISDATAGLLRHRIATYTSQVCENLEVPTKRVRYGQARFDPEQERFVAGEFNLPINPYNNKPIFLVPKRYIRPLPTINADDYWEYCFDNEKNIVREMFGDDISRKVKKEDIIKLAQRYPQTRENYISYREDHGAEPYDFEADPKGNYIV